MPLKQMSQVGAVNCVIGIVMGLMLAGCNSNRAPNPDAAETIEMSKLAQMNGCFECHRIDATVVGPSFKAIAERYKDAPLAEARALLIDRVKKGSIGQYPTWKGGQGMPPMERRVATEHIQRLVDYILSLRPRIASKDSLPPEPEPED